MPTKRTWKRLTPEIQGENDVRYENNSKATHGEI